MNNAVQIEFLNFILMYILLFIVGIIMKLCKISQTKLLIIASARMTAQLIVAGYILTYLLESSFTFLVVLYLFVMTLFAIHRIFYVNKNLNKKFKLSIALSITLCSVFIIVFFITIIIGESIFNAQYLIPISGMIIGNAMTGVTLGVKAFLAKVKDSKLQIETLLNQGATPKKILIPMVNTALETALLPTMNAMLGMGIVSLPGMMTGQILSGEAPMVAILYQISIMICIASVVCLSVFLSLYLGYKTLYNKNSNINI